MADQFGYVNSAASGGDSHDRQSDLPDDQVSLTSVSPEQLPQTPLLQMSDVCALFGRTERSIRRWIVAGHLLPIRIGGAMFFEASDIRMLIERRLRH